MLLVQKLVFTCPLIIFRSRFQNTVHTANKKVRDDIPMATAVVIVDDVERALPPASAPAPSAPLATHSSAIVTTSAVPSGSPVVVPATNSRAIATTRGRPRLHSNLGRRAHGLRCPHCQRETVTIVEDRIGIGTIIAIVMLAIFFWPLCWLPLCMPSCKRTQHYCGHDTCNKKVGVTHVCS